MRNQILNVGRALSLTEQKSILGGKPGLTEDSGLCDHSGQCISDAECPDAPPFDGRKGFCAQRACDGDPRKYCDLK